MHAAHGGVGGFRAVVLPNLPGDFNPTAAGPMWGANLRPWCFASAHRQPGLKMGYLVRCVFSTQWRGFLTLFNSKNRELSPQPKPWRAIEVSRFLGMVLRPLYISPTPSLGSEGLRCRVPMSFHISIAIGLRLLRWRSLFVGFPCLVVQHKTKRKTTWREPHLGRYPPMGQWEN